MKTNFFVLIILACTSIVLAQGHQVDNDLSSEWEATGFNNGRRIVRDADGYFHMVYHSQSNPDATPGGPCEIYYSHTIVPAPPASSADWMPAILIASPPEDDRYPSIAIEHGSTLNPSNDDTLHVVWQHKDHTSGVYDIWHVSCPNTVNPPPDSWGAPVSIYTSPHNSLVPDIDCSLGNILHVVWQEENHEGQFSEILYLRSADHGITWTNLTNISQTLSTNSQMPDVATVIDFPDSPSQFTYWSNQVHVVWNDDLAASPPNIYYRSSPDAGISWNLSENVSILSGSNTEDGYPSLTVSREDTPHVVWMHGVEPHDPDTPGPYVPGLDPINPNSFPGPIAGMYGQLNQEIRYSNRSGGSWISFEVVSSGTVDNEFPSIACDQFDMLHTAWQAWNGTDYEIWQAHRSAASPAWFGWENISLDTEHDDLFPSEATKKAAFYSEGYDLVWTKIDSDLSAGGHGQLAALSPAHEIWFSGNTNYIYVPIASDDENEITEYFFVETNPVRSGTWINTGNCSGDITIYDISGRIVLKRNIESVDGGFYWNVSSVLPAGTYSILFENNGSRESSNVIVLGE
ncbi:MAG: hypothetical protein GQ565_13320 [Candidatus Aegiribacteria sp.]|nr:hypothetical protein [Candidatus Aegiribacteria sp.]